MNEYAELGGNGKKTMLPLIEGTAGERAIDISKLRDQTGLITLDSGYGNTGSCQSAITFIDGEKGILRYRGIPIEELAEQSTFIETALLIIYGKLPTDAELRRFSDLLTKYELIHEDMKFHFEGFPPNAHPMAILSSMINAAGCYYPELPCAAGGARLRQEDCLYHLSSSHHCRMRLPQLARVTDYLSETTK
jgi:citrate synthase